MPVNDPRRPPKKSAKNPYDYLYSQRSPFSYLYSQPPGYAAAAPGWSAIANPPTYTLPYNYQPANQGWSAVANPPTYTTWQPTASVPSGYAPAATQTAPAPTTAPAAAGMWSPPGGLTQDQWMRMMQGYIPYSAANPQWGGYWSGSGLNYGLSNLNFEQSYEGAPSPSARNAYGQPIGTLAPAFGRSVRRFNAYASPAPSWLQPGVVYRQGSTENTHGRMWTPPAYKPRWPNNPNNPPKTKPTGGYQPGYPIAVDLATWRP